MEVFFCHRTTPSEQAQAGFGVEFDWDVSLVEGYPARFLKNVAKRPSIARFDGLDTPEIQSLIAQGKYDAVVVCGWNYKSAWQAIRTCWRTKIPLMVRSDSHLHTPRSLPKRTIKWFIYRWFIPRFDACLAVGIWSRDYFLHYGAQPHRVFLVPHGVDEDRFVRQALQSIPQRSEYRRQWGLEREATVFLFSGKFIPEKRPMDFAQAVCRAAQPGRLVMGLMVGDGPLRPVCEAYVKQQGTPIRFTGFLNQTQIIRAYVATDALVVPSESETWGIVVNEAMSCGRPCIVSNQVGCSPDLIVLGETGAVFPMGNVEALSGLLTYYAMNPTLLGPMGDRARERLKGYSVQVAVEELLKAMDAVRVHPK
jgi:glycosyltransferase involved in cell wall biosynthesis